MGPVERRGTIELEVVNLLGEVRTKLEEIVALLEKAGRKEEEGEGMYKTGRGKEVVKAGEAESPKGLRGFPSG